MALKTYRPEHFPFLLKLQFPAGPGGPAICPLVALRVLPITLPLSDPPGIRLSPAPRPLLRLTSLPGKFFSFFVQPVFPNFACTLKSLG